MTTPDVASTPAQMPTEAPDFRPGRSPKITAEHLERLAVVYVRQSSPQQVLENRESTARQYALAEYAAYLGWPAERVLVIDEDQGQSGASADNRSGFQRLLAEVTMEHVGLVLGLEMSRLARSSKDWHHLFDLCGIFGSLLADQEGIYNANDPNDRLILGMKGIMSEMELQTMRNRLDRGRMNKAQRGEMFHGVPMGYVILPNGEVDFEPDEQARGVVQLVFDKFKEVGSIYGLFHWLLRNDIEMPIRARTGANKGQLEWRRPSISTLAQVLRHPIYAGAYAYGRRPLDPKRKANSSNYRPWVPMDQWKVLIKDRLPAYITWQQYEENRERIEKNRVGSQGVARDGSALLPGVVVCAKCGRHMSPSYSGRKAAHYSCNSKYLEGVESHCYSLASPAIDELVVQQVLRALEPAAVELSIKAQSDIRQERDRLAKHWHQRQKRARYDAELAERRYQAVDPGNRMVASTLERRWEEALNTERQLQEEYDRFQREKPVQLTGEEQERIAALSGNIPELWKSAGTTNADRKAVIRCIVERVVVDVSCESEVVDATIHWAGGYKSQHEVVRPVGTYAQLRDFEQLLNRVTELRNAGNAAAQIAKQLNADGFSPPKRRGEFTAPIVYQLLKRRGLIGNERSHDELLGTDEWWLTDLARELSMSHMKLRDWTKRGWLHGRKTPVQGRWILWVDAEELPRLRQLLDQSRRGINTYTSDLKTPKTRPSQGQ